MKNVRHLLSIAIMTAIVALMTAVGAMAQNSDNARPVSVPQGEKVKVQGVISIRNGDMFKVRDPSGNETTVARDST